MLGKFIKKVIVSDSKGGLGSITRWCESRKTQLSFRLGSKNIYRWQQRPGEVVRRDSTVKCIRT